MGDFRILLAENDEHFVQALADFLSFHRPNWKLVVAADSLEFEQQLQRGPFDAVLADSAFKGFRTDELLAAVALQIPSAIRISLSEIYDGDAGLKAMEHAHQTIWKPCESEEVCDTLTRAFSLRSTLNHDRLKLLITQIDSLPSLPRLYFDFLDEVRKPNPSSTRLSEIIKQDISLCAKLLQLVNSAFFGLPHSIENPEEALLYLGIENVKALVLSIQVFSLYDKMKGNGFNLDALWEHSWETGRIARQIATFEERPTDEVETAFTAGLLHDIGKLVIASGVPRTWQKIVKTAEIEGLSLWQTERQVLGTSHAEVGASLLATWGLSNRIVEAVAFHHSPEHSGIYEFSALAAVYGANLLSAKQVERSQECENSNSTYLDSLKLSDHVTAWRERFVQAA